MQRNIINYDDLKKITIEFMKENNLIDLVSLVSARKPESVWGILCIKLIGRYEFNVAQNIHNIWMRNTKRFKTEIIELLEIGKISKKTSKKKSDCLIKKFISIF